MMSEFLGTYTSPYLWAPKGPVSLLGGPRIEVEQCRDVVEQVHLTIEGTSRAAADTVSLVGNVVQ